MTSDRMTFKNVVCLEKDWLPPDMVIPWFENGLPYFYLGHDSYSRLQDYRDNRPYSEIPLEIEMMAKMFSNLRMYRRPYSAMSYA